MLRDATNHTFYRAVTVRGAPKNVAHAVRLLRQVKRKKIPIIIFVSASRDSHSG